MTNQKYTKLTNTVYGLLDFFPEDEPLKNKAKEKALAVLENLILAFLPSNNQKGMAASQALKDIEVLEGYLSLGKEKEWVNNMNLMILLKEYDQVKKEIKPIVVLSDNPWLSQGQKQGERLGLAKDENKEKKEKPVEGNVDKLVEKPGSLALSERQSKILEILKSQEKVQVADLKKALPEVTKRTLRRDLDVLLKTGKIKRIGEWNQVFYQLSGSPHSRADMGFTMGQNNDNNDRTLLLS